MAARKATATLVNTLPGLPFGPFRTSLYSVDELYDHYDPAVGDASWKASFDYRAYAWFMDEATQVPKALATADTLFSRLHDSALEAAVARFISDRGQPVVGFMGGHDTPRDSPVFQAVADLARRFARLGYMVLTGGGPGLMEAANLGAFLAPYDDAQLDAVLASIAKAPKYNSSGWLALAWAQRQRLLATATTPGESLGIPTWLYGYEPPNVFASHHGKLFYNSLREDGLVTLADAGLVFGPGNAGTVQEIFQDATQNYYRKPGIAPTPMALLGKAFWSRDASAGPDTKDRTKPLEPLLIALAGEKPSLAFSSAVLLTDDVEAIIALVEQTRQAAAPTKGQVWLQVKVQAVSGS
jgi:predicted Rossmann-fold nucleotide-binding protein